MSDLIHGDCIEVMATLPETSVDAIVTDPPYGINFMGKAWDGAAIAAAAAADAAKRPRPAHRIGKGKSAFGNEAGYAGAYDFSLKGNRAFQEWSYGWAEAAYRVAKPSAYLLAFGGTRTVHRMTCALEDAGWIIRDMLVWGYASGFPKSKASLKPAWEPIVMARKPGPLRMLAIDECRIGTDTIEGQTKKVDGSHDVLSSRHQREMGYRPQWQRDSAGTFTSPTVVGRWPANIMLTDPIFDGGIEGVVGGGETGAGGNINGRPVTGYSKSWADERWFEGYADTGTYSRFFLVPKSSRSDREPVLGGLPYGAGPVTRQNIHPTVKPVDLMRHLVRLVTPTGGVVLDPFLGSGTTALAAEMEGFDWIGIEREAEYVAIAEARLNGTQRGLGLEAS